MPFLGGFGVLLAAQPRGEWWTLAFLLVVIVTDIGAYVSGLLFGKHPMAPRISPKKTWEGFVGSVVFALVASILLSVFMLEQEWWFGFVFGFTMVLTATIGDLTESLIKRDLGIKDISTWLPGHGASYLGHTSNIPGEGVLQRGLAVKNTRSHVHRLFVIIKLCRLFDCLTHSMGGNTEAWTALHTALVDTAGDERQPDDQ